MDASGDALEQYEEMALVTGRMLEAARQGDWERLAGEERRCRELVGVLRSREEAPLTAEQLRRKHSILRKMLADDADIRRLAEPWLRNLESLMASSGNKRRLEASYGDRA